MLLWAPVIMCNNLIEKRAIQIMGMTRESKLKNAFATPLRNSINNKVTELKVSELSFKHMFNEKEPIVGDNKGILRI